MARGLAVLLLACGCGSKPIELTHQAEIAGEVGPTQVLLQSRLVGNDVLPRGDHPGAPGVARFEISADEGFEGAIRTAWIDASPERDHVVRARITELQPGTTYFYRLQYGPTRSNTTRGPTRRFRTLTTGLEPVEMIVTTCLHLERFAETATPDQIAQGFPGLRSIRELDPDLVVLAGDNVYYDHAPIARTPEALRTKWHLTFQQSNAVDMLGHVATFWMKDDHDFRFDDADPFRTGQPTAEAGVAMFLEQAPLAMPGETPVPYRTFRLGELARVWLLESRELRDANDDPDGPDKSLWGDAQRQWLMDGLLASDAPFRLVITPTPLVGPDDARKRDNHTNADGFRTEGESFMQWAADNDVISPSLLWITGDRHWQYHSVHPSGLEEISVGPLVDGNARLGVEPGDPEGTDPDATIDQRFVSPEATGGFLRVALREVDGEVELVAELRDEQSRVLYSLTRRAPL